MNIIYEKMNKISESDQNILENINNLTLYEIEDILRYNISEKKLYTFAMGTKTKQFKVITKLQDKNMKALGKFLYKVFNQIKIINTN